MSYILFLNELSFGAAANKWAADAAMVEFDNVLRAFYDWNSDTSLVDHIGLKSIELAPGYKFSQWINAESANKDRWQMIRLRQSKAPFRVPALPGDVEYRYRDQTVQGLGFAHHHEGVCVSLHIGDAWDSSEILVDCGVIDDGASSGVVIRQEQAMVAHSATCDNAASHKSWWQRPRPRLPVKLEGRRFRHHRFGTITECLDGACFYSVDRARHGSSAVKRFVEQADGLHWDADLDADGNVIINKHKSSVGIKIPKGELHAI